MSMKVLFIDRDGTLIEEPHDNQVDSLDKFIKRRSYVADAQHCKQRGRPTLVAFLRNERCVA